MKKLTRVRKWPDELPIPDAIILDFDNDTHHRITMCKGMTNHEIGDVLISAGYAILKDGISEPPAFQWISASSPPPEDEFVVVKCKSGYLHPDFIFRTARYQPTYRPKNPWRTEGGDALDDEGLIPIEWTRDLSHKEP